jgi:arabinofuranosyltransferase
MIINDPPQTLTESQRESTLLLYLFLIFLSIILIKSAWLSDDSFITFRTVDNFINGHGLRWNIAERVHTNTHPFWMFFVSFFYFFTGEIYYTVIILSLFLSFLSVFMVSRRLAVNQNSLFIVFSIFISSRAFVDYSTSGLETPLSYLLFVIFSLNFFKRHWTSKNLVLLYMISSLAMFNRMDTILLYFPPLIYATYKAWKTGNIPILNLLKKLMVGFAPLLLWILFSLIYYGFPFPNTYYAKLKTGIGAWTLFHQGILYVIDSLSRDTITLVVIAFSLLLTLKIKEGKKTSAAVGILLYVLYVIKIGGDFMSGRFFAMPLFAAAVLISQVELKRSFCIILSILFLLIGLSGQHPTIFYNKKDSAPPKSNTGIVDEREYYFPSTGLITGSRYQSLPHYPTIRQAKKARMGNKKIYVKPNIGFFGYYAGPQIHIVDTMGLCDPLLAHLPVDETKKWRIGHFERAIPKGYPETLNTGQNCIEDPEISKLYDIITEITRGKIFSLKRFILIIKFNLGYYDNLKKGIFSINDFP